jgi:hypothetical protein
LFGHLPTRPCNIGSNEDIAAMVSAKNKFFNKNFVEATSHEDSGVLPQ